MLDESMHKSTVSLGVGGGDTKGKEAVIVVSTNNPGPTFNNGEGGWYVVNHGVDCRDNVGECGLPLWINGVDRRYNFGRCH